MGSFNGREVDDPSVSEATVENDLGEASTFDTDQRNGEGSRAVLLGRKAHGLSSLERLDAPFRSRTQVQSQRWEGEPGGRTPRGRPDFAGALVAPVFEWTNSYIYISLESTPWTTKDALRAMAGGPSAEKQGGLSVRVPSEFPEQVEPLQQFVADFEQRQR